MKTKSRFHLPFVGPSTKAFIDEARQAEGYSWKDLVHGLIYARWPYEYIGIGIGEHRIAKLFRSVARPVRRMARVLSPGASLLRRSRKAQPRAGRSSEWPMASGTHADGYHGKVMPLQSARRLVQVKEPINLPDLEQVIPYPRARALILKNPDHIAVLDCPCRAARPNPCLPLDVCLIVGEPFVSMMLEHHPDKARRITPERAEQILIETDARGNVHHAFFKEAMLGRFYAICNCCDCCCGAMQSQRHNKPMLASSGYVAEVDEALCIGCGECAERCQFHAITLPDGISSVIDEELCMGCGVCVNGCVQGALSLRREASKGIPLELQELVGI